MREYLLQRLAVGAITLWVISVVAFLVVRLLPGDVVSMMLEDLGYAHSMEALRQKLGLDKPILVQYGVWVGKMLRGDFGQSLWTQKPVVTMLKERLPVTLELALLSILIAIVWGVGLGLLSALRQDSLLDYLGRSTAILLLSLPAFWLGTLVWVLPSAYLGWSPSPEYRPFLQDPLGNLVQFIIPAGILGSHLGAPVMRMSRAMMLEVLRQDYIRTAWAKGLSERLVVMRHALKNALIPVITILGLQLANAIGGSVLMETIFQLPGMGSLVVTAVGKRDYVVVQELVLFFALVVLAVNLAVDIVYGWLDPRIRLK
ncbi:Glutathione transport system permease protein GsiC [bacterium HR23]|nr:Glutathione transport system permease protein GsiC [bacterium HR23]